MGGLNEGRAEAGSMQAVQSFLGAAPRKCEVMPQVYVALLGCGAGEEAGQGYGVDNERINSRRKTRDSRNFS